MLAMLGLTGMPMGPAATPAPAAADTAMDVETPAAAPTPAAPPPMRSAEVSTPEGTVEGEADQTKEPVKMEEDPAEEAPKPDDGSA